MSVELEEALPPTGAEGAGGRAGAAAPRRRRSRKKNQPGRYSQLVLDTIRRLGERGGSSLARIHAEARRVAWFDQQHGRTYLKYALRALVHNDTLLQVRGTGANGSFKLNRGKPAGGARRAATAPATAAAPGAATPAAAAPGAPARKAKKAAAPRRAEPQPPARAAPAAAAEKRAHKRGAAKDKDKDKGGAKATKVKKATKPSVPKVPKGRK